MARTKGTYIKVIYVVVNKHIIKKNKKEEIKMPVFRCSNGKYGKPYYLDNIEGLGKYHLKYDPDNPMPCGATVWMEIDA